MTTTMNTEYQNIFREVVSEMPNEQQDIINNDVCDVVATNSNVTCHWLKQYQIPACVLHAHELTHQKMQNEKNEHLSYIDNDVKDLFFYDGLCWYCLIKYVFNETGQTFPAVGEDGDTCIAYECAAISIDPHENVVTKYVNVIEDDVVRTKQYKIPYILPQYSGCSKCKTIRQHINATTTTFVMLHCIKNTEMLCPSCGESACIDNIRMRNAPNL